MRRFGMFSGLSMAVFVGACGIFAVGCEGSEEAPAPGEAKSGPAARAVEHVRLDPSRAFVDEQHELEVRNTVVDLDGREHVHLDRKYKGLRVLGGDFIVHGRVDGSFDSVTQTLSRRIDLDISEPMPEDIAIVIAQGEQTAERLDKTPKANLVVYARGERPALAYEVVVEGILADQTPSELHVIIDARTGEVLESFEGIETEAVPATGNGFFSGITELTTNQTSATSFELKDPSRGNHYTADMKRKQSGKAVLFIDADNLWGTGAVDDLQSIAVDAQYGIAETWDYYLNVHGRSGIANNGKGAYNRVNYGVKYNNAFWSDSCFCMTYGNGDGVVFNPFDSLDVAGHEMTHGVTSRTANLVYSGEAGGLNEATSDIFGTMVEFYAANANDTPDWEIGEELYKSGLNALRYMYDPDKDGLSKGCYSTSIGSLNVHYSSGVANHFFYLLSEGSDSPDTNTCSTGLTVTGIGKQAAEKIWYRALSIYMISSTKYAGARQATIKAANDLYGAGSVEANAVATAWSAVKVN